MNTRLLESNEVIRNTVFNLEVIEAQRATLLFKTRSFTGFKAFGTHVDESVRDRAEQSLNNHQVEGRLRIDVLTDSMIRIRYAEGKSVPENDTAMVVGSFNGPSKAETQIKEDRVVYETGSVRIIVHLIPFYLVIRTLENDRICGISGPEQNNFSQWDSYNTGVCHSIIDGTPIAVESFDLAPHEAIYGFGEKFMRLNNVGRTINLNMQEPFGTNSTRTYKNIPFFVSTKGYGVFFNHSSRMTCWAGSMSAVDLQVAAEDDFIDYYVMTGGIKEVLSQYTDITGKGSVPPLWSFGYWQSKISYKSADEALDVARKLREAEIPCDVIHLDTNWFKEDWYCNLEFSEERFPDPKKFFEEMTEMGFKVSLWQLPYIPEGSALFDELKAVGGFVKNKDGEDYNVGICMTPGWSGFVGCIDYTNPKAVEVHQKWFRKLFDLGAKVIKVDFGEEAPIDGVYHDGTPGHQAHNLYPLLYNKAVFEVTKNATGEGIIWARSAWAGSQRYPLHWGGDNSPHFSNIIPQIESGLSFGLSGFQFWSQDIGGFMGPTYDMLLIRWMQVGLFLSHARIHGVGNRELYKFEPETIRICRDYLRLRYRLLPYIYGSAIDCVERSLPMARALVVEFQNDPNVWNIGNEYMFGDSLLVAPITDKSNRRAIYLPEGVWTDWWTGERLSGGRWINVEVDMETMPLYIREGGIIPMGPIMNYVGEIKTDEIQLRIALFDGDGKSTFAVPVNEEKIPVEYIASNGKHTVKIGRNDIVFKIEASGDKNKSIETIYV